MRMTKVSVNPPSGFRDFLPKEAMERSFLLETISRVYRSHGFETIGISMLESLSTLQGKGGGSDNEKLIFKILKRGDELKKALETNEALADMGLRFDLTLPLARYCARFREQLPKPFKVFQIGPVWRADRPQKGRYREFYQCDLDIIGAKEIGAEIDCMEAILSVFSELKMEGIELHLNDRRLLAALRGEIAEKDWSEALVILDKLDKIQAEGVAKELEAKFGKVPEGIKLALAGAELESFREFHSESVDSLQKILALLGRGKFSVKFNPSLVRGQDYYTGTIFEVRHPELSGSLGGGGRYNRLLEVFGTDEVPAFGGSIGFERLHLLLAEKGIQTKAAGPQIFFPLFSEEMRAPVLEIAGSLRSAGFRVDVYPDAAKLKNQFKYADDRGASLTAILGADEWKAGSLKVKRMSTREEKTVALKPESSLVKEIQALLVEG